MKDNYNKMIDGFKKANVELKLMCDAFLKKTDKEYLESEKSDVVSICCLESEEAEFIFEYTYQDLSGGTVSGFKEISYDELYSVFYGE